MTPSRDAKNDAPMAYDATREPLDLLSIELTRISAEIQSINSGFQAQMQQAVAQVREAIENEYRARMEKSIGDIREKLRNEIEEQLRKDFESELCARMARLDGVENEIVRVLGQIESITKEIAAMLDDPSVELARVMRKRTEQAELRAYLNGLRFSTGGQSKAKSSGA
jgi:archaellum component FlaC